MAKIKILKKTFKKLLRSKLITNMISSLIYYYALLIGKTTKWQTKGIKEFYTDWEKNKSIILIGWHGRAMLYPYFWNKKRPLNALVSLHQDGRLIAGFLEKCGLGTIGGSSNGNAVGSARDLIESLQKDTAICTIEPCLFKSPLKPGRYKAIYDFNFQPSTEFRLTDTKVIPVEGSERNWTFGLRVLPSGRDSIHIIWENHTNLKVYLNSCPVIQTAIYKEELHPLPLTIFTREHADWLQEHTTLYGGNAIRLSLPTSWDLDSIPRIQKIIPYKSLPNGRYQVIMPINLEVECEFEIKENKTSN